LCPEPLLYPRPECVNENDPSALAQALGILHVPDRLTTPRVG
jgi:hypothetical protein